MNMDSNIKDNVKSVTGRLCEPSSPTDHRGVDLISDALPFGRLCYGRPNAASNAVSYAMHYSRSHDAVIRVYDVSGNVIETHEHAGEFKESHGWKRPTDFPSSNAPTT